VPPCRAALLQDRQRLRRKYLLAHGLGLCQISGDGQAEQLGDFADVDVLIRGGSIMAADVKRCDSSGARVGIGK
jgi:hypothetical protein